MAENGSPWVRDISSDWSVCWKSYNNNSTQSNSRAAALDRRFRRFANKLVCQTVATNTLSSMECEKRFGKTFWRGDCSNHLSSQKKVDRPLYVSTNEC